ncbi:hypothetical protein [Flavobacterium sp. N2820]|uniref:YobI family P-loop NTPase n=1 Tax=Flavobacterium sp. N2820 TaxID=2986834 RepID=UPI0022241E8A|nr:hypothetical protein [Flavobacterium sp. N2820]
MTEKIIIKLKKFKSDVYDFLIDNIIILKLNDLAKKKSISLSERTIEGFSAKILNEEQDKHSILLKEAIGDSNIFNIALSGPYGSGKTSIIKTFKHIYPLSYIDISLATFDDKFVKDEKITSKLEYCILKQLFYKVHPDKVPESRFKRIVNHKYIALNAFLFFCWLISILYFTNNNILDSLIFALGLDFYSSFFNGVYSIVSFAGLIFIVYKVYDFFINFKMTKFKINEAELESKHEKATINFENEIDEILYFFERNPIDVVFFEDLDRFNNTEIYIKLREINFLINNYEPIREKGKVTFVYAVIDDIFTQNERTKFFDFILPVVPIINYTNSAIELIRRFNNEIESIENINEKREFKNFIEKVSLYLSDMRVIISIANEYKVYKNILNENVDEKKLFAMMVYKNVEPTEFDLLNNRKGYVYQLLKNKIKLIDDTIKKIEQEINTFEGLIDLLNKEILTNTKELRMLYVAKFLEIVNQRNGHGVINVTLNSKKINPSDLVQEENFKIFTKNNHIYYDWYSSNSHSIQLSFNEIEKAVNPSINYSQRLERITNKASNNIEELRIKVEINQNKIKSINSKKLSELLNEFESINYFKQLQLDYEKTLEGDENENKVKNYDLINFLVKVGYIDEDYEHYISRQDGNLSKEDRDFLLSFNSKQLPFDIKLNEFNSILNKIDDAYFYRQEILNFSLMDYLIESNKSVEIIKIMNVLKNETENSILFIDEYLQYTNDTNKNIFIRHVSNTWTNIFNYLENSTEYSIDKKSSYLRLLFKNIPVSKIKELNKNKSIFYFLNYSESLASIYFEDDNKTKVEQFLKDEKVQFDRLIFDDKHVQLLKFIYENNLYEINFDMIKLMISAFKTNDVDLKELNLKNYTLISNSGCTRLNSYIDYEIEYYLECVLFEFENNLNESEQSVLKILNELVVSEELEIQLIEKNNTLINKLIHVKEKNLWPIFFNNNKLIVSWQNIIDYFKEFNEIDNVLVEYLNRKEIFDILSKEIIEEEDDRIKTQFITKLIHSSIDIESYSSLATKIPYHYNFSEVEGVEKNKVEILIKNNVIPFSVENFTDIKNIHEQLILIYSELNKDDFFESIEELPFTSTIVLDIMNSKVFSEGNKLDVIKTIDENLIIEDRNLQSFICKFLLNQVNISISETLLNSLLSSNNLISTKVALFNKYYTKSLPLDKLNARLISLGSPFINLTENLETIDLLDTVENNQFYLLLFRRILGSKKEKNGKLKIWQLKNKR